MQNAGMHRLALSLLLFLPLASPAQEMSPSLLQAVERHARSVAPADKGTVSIEIRPVDTSRLPQCSQAETFSPPGIRPMGNTHIGLRCLAPSGWSILVPVRIDVTGNYLTTARGLSRGHEIRLQDVNVAKGNLSDLPVGAIASPEEAVGKILKNPLAAGQPIRHHQLAMPRLVKQQQVVKVISRSPSFTASAEGKALNEGGLGDIVRVKMPNGRVVSGHIQEDGTILLQN